MLCLDFRSLTKPNAPLWFCRHHFLKYYRVEFGQMRVQEEIIAAENPGGFAGRPRPAIMILNLFLSPSHIQIVIKAYYPVTPQGA